VDPIAFPGDRRFAFTILDDTDDSTLENARPVYERLRDLGFRTTKTVWPFGCTGRRSIYSAADTLERAEYLAFVRELVDSGFELASHGATMESSTREETERSIDFLEREFGRCPRLYVNHGQNRENLYWGPKRFQTALLRWLFTRFRDREYFCGERPDTPYYWGDLASRHFEYVRNFTFRKLNMLRVNPEMPYRLEGTPDVPFWFSTTDAPNACVFTRRLTRQALEALEEEGGVCIVSTHLGKGFMEGGSIRPEIDEIFRYLAGRPGYYVPVSELLDELRAQGRGIRLGVAGIWRLECRYVVDKLADRLASVTEG
jgi:hypothetical protein